jgi:hypothetical protein
VSPSSPRTSRDVRDYGVSTRNVALGTIGSVAMVVS